MFQFSEVQFIVLNVVFDATRGANQNVDSITDCIDWTKRREQSGLLLMLTCKICCHQEKRHCEGQLTAKTSKQDNKIL